WHHTLYERAVRQYPHAVLIPVDDYNILPYLYAADTLLSEASSTMFDFVALAKTGIIFVLPSEPLQHHDGEAILTEDPQHFLRGAFVHISHPDAISQAVAEALCDDAQRREQARQYRDYLFFGLDGQASQRVKSTIERLLAEGGHANCPGSQRGRGRHLWMTSPRNCATALPSRCRWPRPRGISYRRWSSVCGRACNRAGNCYGVATAAVRPMPSIWPPSVW